METHFCKAGLRYYIKVVLQVAVSERLMCRGGCDDQPCHWFCAGGFMVSFQGERRGCLGKSVTLGYVLVCWRRAFPWGARAFRPVTSHVAGSVEMYRQGFGVLFRHYFPFDSK